jgi:putative FmdB family regulatory protein
MPIYEYRCAACGHELEALQKLADSPLKDCPSCGQSRLSKLVSLAGFRLKGSGWYATDFKQPGKTAAKNNGESANSEPAVAGDAAAKPATGESKPAASESKPAARESKPAAGESKPAASESKPAPKPATDGGSTH